MIIAGASNIRWLALNILRLLLLGVTLSTVTRTSTHRNMVSLNRVGPRRLISSIDNLPSKRGLGALIKDRRSSTFNQWSPSTDCPIVIIRLWSCHVYPTISQVLLLKRMNLRKESYLPLRKR